MSRRQASVVWLTLGSLPLNVHAFRSSHICHAIRAIIDLVHIDAFVVKPGRELNRCLDLISVKDLQRVEQNLSLLTKLE